MADTDFERQPRRVQADLVTCLEKYPWTHAVSLAFNSGQVRPKTADDRLGQLVARLNRKAVGPRWKQKPDEQIFSFWFLEKPRTNTHWHGVMWLEVGHISKLTAEQSLQNTIMREWSKLVSPGTVMVKSIWEQQGWLDYIAKEVRDPVSYENFRAFTGIE